MERHDYAPSEPLVEDEYYYGPSYSQRRQRTPPPLVLQSPEFPGDEDEPDINQRPWAFPGSPKSTSISEFPTFATDKGEPRFLRHSYAPGSENSEQYSERFSERFSEKMDVLQIHLRHPNVIPPKRATMGSAGFDLFLSTNETILIGMNQIVFHFGLQIPFNTVGVIRERSSAAMRNIVTHAGVIDADFHPSNDLRLILENKSDKTIELKRKQAVAQLIILRLATITREVYVDYNYPTRGKKELTRGFGSTGNVPVEVPTFNESNENPARQIDAPVCRGGREKTPRASQSQRKPAQPDTSSRYPRYPPDLKICVNLNPKKSPSEKMNQRAELPNPPKSPPARQPDLPFPKDKKNFTKNSSKNRKQRNKSLYDRLG